MALVLCDDGAKIALERLVNKETDTGTDLDLVLKLYSNDVIPDGDDEIGDYDELTASPYTDYADKLLTGATWNSAVTGDPTYILYSAVQTFTFDYDGSALPIYGYYITNKAEDTLIYAERFTAAPLSISVSGDNINITPRIEAS